MAPPECNICSYRRYAPLGCIPIYHLHYSSRETRFMQGVEGSTSNRVYMCPTCQIFHPWRVDYGLNVCLADSQLHEFNWPKDPEVHCPPDSRIIDNIPFGTMPV